MTDRQPAAELAIYVHWPFCLSKCPYCDFNSYVAVNIDQRPFARALVQDLNYFAALAPDRTVTSIFFGGGTPSLMEPATVAMVLDAVAARWPLAAGVEVTMECNPTSADAARFEGFHLAGVTRVSVGVQALDDAALAFLGRQHSSSEAREAILRSQRLFARTSFDLIYGLPEEHGRAWKARLQEACALAGEHLSVYQLSIEAGTAFARDGILTADADTQVALFEITQEVLEGAGLPAYEVSNHARAGGECRHNLSVWQGGDYLGIGPGAHGRLHLAGKVLALRQTTSPNKWLKRVEERGNGLSTEETLTPLQRIEEVVMLGLRLTRGLDRDRFFGLFGVPIEEALDAEVLNRMVVEGLLACDQAGVRVTEIGRLVLDRVVTDLLA